MNQASIIRWSKQHGLGAVVALIDCERKSEHARKRQNAVNLLTSDNLRGNWATILLPVQANDEIDYALLGDEIDYFAACRVDGVYSNGSAGEFYTQTEEEFDRIHELLAQKCHRTGMPFQIGVCHMSPQLSLCRLRRARALRPCGFQVILPDWFPPTFAEVGVFLERMAEAAGEIPLIVYNPAHAKVRLSPAEWLELAERIPTIVGIKVPGGDDAWYAAMAPLLRRWSVFIPGHLLADGLARGARGAYSNVACLSPVGAQLWYALCVESPAAGAALGRRVREFWEAWIAPLVTLRRLSNTAADKAAAVAGSWLPGFTPRLRWPYRSVSVEEARKIGERARALLPEFFLE